MSNLARVAVQQAVSRMQMKPVMIDPQSIPSLVQTAQLLMAGGEIPPDMDEDMICGMHDTLCQTYGYSGSTRGKNFAFAEGTAIIPVHGTLINRFGGCYHGYMTGYNFIRRQRAEALADPDVERIIYDVNSRGGEAAGCFELADESFELRGKKPTLAMVDADCYSAAYAFASSADKISVTPSGGAGSIGVISMHADLSKLLDNVGVTISLITAGEHKADGNPFSALSPEVRASIQADVDDTRDKFVALVARNRGIDEKVVRDTEARTYSAEDALALNLIDEVATPAMAINSFINGPSGSGKEANVMKPEEQANTPQPDANAAKTAERERIAGIMGCEAAQGKSKLANHLALSTDMSVAEATAILENAAPETQAAAPAPAAPAVPAAPTAEANAFKQAMDSGNNPGVGPDDQPSSERAEKEVNPLEDAYMAATGYTFDQK